MFRFAFASCLPLLLASLAPAAVVYAPVQSQYQTSSGHVFYYGGNRESVFALAERLDCLQGLPGGYLHPGLIHHPGTVLTDCTPYLNAAVYGYTPADSRNEAYANVPRYFRKADVLAAAPVAPDGTVFVPAQQVPMSEIEIRPYAPRRRATPSTQPSARPLLILPKPALPGSAVVEAR